MLFLRTVTFLILLAAVYPITAREVELRLTNGDRVTGEVCEEQPDHLVLSNSWAAALEIPRTEIIEEIQLHPPREAAIVVALPTPPPSTPKPSRAKLWKFEAQTGLDFAYGIRERQIYYGKLRTDYKRPYAGDPLQSARLGLAYNAEYGRTDGVLSANRMDGGVDSEFDLSRRIFVSDEARVGYNEIRKIDLQYEIGPAIGVHIVRTDDLKLDTSLGVNYQEEYESDGMSDRAIYLQLAQGFKWQVNHRISMDQKLEFFPAFEDFNQFRARLEFNLKYKLLENLSLNFSVQDFYDTDPAATVNRNELKIRSSLGVTF